MLEVGGVWKRTRGDGPSACVCVVVVVGGGTEFGESKTVDTAYY